MSWILGLYHLLLASVEVHFFKAGMHTVHMLNVARGLVFVCTVCAVLDS